jgi:hypothetical protein
MVDSFKIVIKFYPPLLAVLLGCFLAPLAGPDREGWTGEAMSTVKCFCIVRLGEILYNYSGGLEGYSTGRIDQVEPRVSRLASLAWYREYHYLSPT